jgi:nucleoside-diphosphate-sugar epimerase
MPAERRVLVTGAGGFIGGRVVEVLHQLGADVRAGVRRWASGARIGRLPIDLVACDLDDPRQLDEACAGVDAIVHCAVNLQPIPDAERQLRHLLDAATRHGVCRFVHLSTMEVYGEPEGDIDETRTCTPEQAHSHYARLKIRLEDVCREYLGRGLPVVVLRPTIVYGPFSESWTVEIAQRLLTSTWSLSSADTQGTCNLVYIDDLMAAIVSALEVPGAVGEVFNINGPERLTWDDYFQAMSRALGIGQLRRRGALAARTGAWLTLPVRKSAKFVLQRYQAQIMGLYQRSPLARKLMRRAERFLRQVPTPQEFRLCSRKAFYVSDKAARLLGYQPRFDTERGVGSSVAWLKHEGYA